MDEKLPQKTLEPKRPLHMVAKELDVAPWHLAAFKAYHKLDAEHPISKSELEAGLAAILNLQIRGA